jgi:hypothetical protein
MTYFDFFPTTYYDLDGSGKINYSKVVDITKRLSFIPALMAQGSLFYPYTIKTGDTPENISNRYYGSPNFFWVVLLFNSIMDPQLDWPLDDEELFNYMVAQYGLANLNAAHHYTLNINTTDITSLTTTNFIYVIDQPTYNKTPQFTEQSFETQSGFATQVITTTSIVTNSEYATTINEAKRQINILKKDYLGILENNLKAAFQ